MSFDERFDALVLEAPAGPASGGGLRRAQLALAAALVVVLVAGVVTAVQRSSHHRASVSSPAVWDPRVEPIALPLSDPLARIDGLLNAIQIQTDTPAEVTVIGPGAGRFQAGQGMLADLISIAKAL